MTRFCKICGIVELEDDDPDICLICQASIMLNKDIRP
jgi:rubrerythrin